MPQILDGQRAWEGAKDEDGHRNYDITHVVEAYPWEGPASVMQTPGLPVAGSFWHFDSDIDLWAFCYPYMKVSVYGTKEGSPSKFWLVEQKFSTKPLKRCNDVTIEDPLLEPQKVSGSFVKYSKEAQRDRFRRLITSSSHEPLKGPGVEFDRNRPTVRIEQNVANLELEIFSSMIDSVNDLPLWGLPPRCVKLSGISWERKLFGICNYYYTRTFDFDIDFETFDRHVPDEGTKVLHGHWRFRKKKDKTSPTDPDHFVLTFNGISTGFLNSTASTTVIQSALENLTSIGSGNVSVTGGPLPHVPVLIEFVGSKGLSNQPLISVGGHFNVVEVQFGSSFLNGNEIQRLFFEQDAWVLDSIDGGPPDESNPQHFMRFKDRNGENCRTLLNGHGLPAATPILGFGTGSGTGTGTIPGTGTGTGSLYSRDAAEIFISYYEEDNMLLLGLPTSF